MAVRQEGGWGMSKEAIKLALEALEQLDGIDTETECVTIDVGDVITALREALAEQPAQQEPVAAECKFEGTKEWVRCSVEHHNLVQSEPHKWPDYQTRLLYTSPPAQRPHECSRSHPHENMDAMCELRTEIARLTNENARLKAQPQQEPFGYLYEGTAEHTRHKTVFEKTRAERFETRWWREIGPCYTSPPAKRKPLTDDEILEILCIHLDKDDDIEEWRHEINEARAIEAAHGIKGEA